jgi:Uma2 family endonuclease
MLDTQVVAEVPLLCAGDHLDWPEFERRWDALPNLKRAELIDGRVIMPSPLSKLHGRIHQILGCVCEMYAMRTQTIEVFNNATLVLGPEDAPQPDLTLRKISQGASADEGQYLHGAPEMIIEVCLTSASYDLYEKKALYERVGVQEYLCFLVGENRVSAFQLQEGAFRALEPDADGVVKSAIFPGLWLDTRAILAGRAAEALATLERGLTECAPRA